MNIYVVDTNVILLAGTRINDLSVDQIDVFKKCIDFLHQLMNDRVKILIDDGCRVINEYRKAYQIDGYPNNATKFFEYACSNSIVIHLEELAVDTFACFPNDSELQSFDPPDRKFIALAYLFEPKAPIAEATDSKWWGIRENLLKNGITVHFIDETYIFEKYKKKFG